ncbi:hypothetical protein OKW30_003551 [Paraburkholderia sp. Clong3]|uniref:hypothetical protein n=1 Tax=Paraburkholderia sp. Clong3 TaxID=2991061 RepID=UPI003D1EAFA7
MIDIIRSEIEVALREGDIPGSMRVLQNWLVHAAEGEPEALLRGTSAGLRPKLVLLMRDLLSRFPATLLGAPLLLFARPDDHLPPPVRDSITLPYPTAEGSQPCAELHFVGWLPINAQLPVPTPFQPHPVTVPWYKATAAIALFRSDPSVFDADELDLPNMWWADLFQPIEACIQLAARILLPYPDAIEAARVMQAYANAKAPPLRGHFLSDSAWHWASSEGALFYETRRHFHS